MDQRSFGAPRSLDQLRQPRRVLRVRLSGRHEIRLEADVVEDAIGGELLGDIGAIGGCGVNAAQRIADAGGFTGIDSARREERFPRRKALGRKIFHGKATGFAVLAQHLRDRCRGDGAGDAHPLGFPSIAADRRPPICSDLQLGKRPFDANRDARGQIHAVDIR